MYTIDVVVSEAALREEIPKIGNGGYCGAEEVPHQNMRLLGSRELHAGLLSGRLCRVSGSRAKAITRTICSTSRAHCKNEHRSVKDGLNTGLKDISDISTRRCISWAADISRDTTSHPSLHAIHPSLHASGYSVGKVEFLALLHMSLPAPVHTRMPYTGTAL